MSTQFSTKLINNVGTSTVTVVTAPSNGTITVIGLSLANLTQDIVKANIIINDNLGNSAYYARNIIVPPNTSLRVVNGGERLTLASNYFVTLSANEAAAFDAVVSYVTIL